MNIQKNSPILLLTLSFVVLGYYQANAMRSKKITLPDYLASDITNNERKGVARALKENRNLINSRGQLKRTPLHLAAAGQDLEMVELLLRYKPEVNAKDTYGRTALHYAAQKGTPKIAEALIAAGASIEAKDQEGMTPWDIALRTNHQEMADFLFNALLENAIAHDNSRAAEEALKKGTQVGAHLRKTILPDAAKKGNLEIVELLLNTGASMNTEDVFGNNPLANAAMTGNLTLVELLIKRGADVKAKDGFGNTALHLAATPPIAEALIAAGAIIDAENDHGDTPLIRAMQPHNPILPLIEFLVKAGANIVQPGNTRNSLHGLSPIEWELKTASSLSRGMRRILQKRSSKNIENLGLETLQLLVNDKNVNTILDTEGNTALHIAARYGNPFSTKYLLSLPSIKTDIKNRDGNTALSIATLKNPFSPAKGSTIDPKTVSCAILGSSYEECKQYYTFLLLRNHKKFNLIKGEIINSTNFAQTFKEAIEDINVPLIKYLLSIPYLATQKDSSAIKEALLKVKSLYESTKNDFLSDDYQEIGSLLIQSLQLTSPEGGVSKSGIAGQFPRELIEIFRTGRMHNT